MVKTEFGYLDPLRVENVDAKNWKLLDRFRLQGSKGDIFEVEAGETTDFATVPWWSQAITPRTGTWTKAAVIHDKMCTILNVYHVLLKQYDFEVLEYNLRGKTDPKPVELEKPIFSSIDTDAIFRKNAREEGTDAIRSELLWMGVRYGALANPARREEWLQTAPRVVADTLVILAALIALVAGLSWIWPF
jgi:hypothetical protein